MEKENWEKIQDLFDKALDLEPSKRIEFLKKECGDDEVLYNEVISLINEDSNAHSIFNEQSRNKINILENISYENKTIGSYKIIRQLAAGGMGTVFLAERADGQFEQKVALKVINPGMNSKEIIKRFQEERQILARLQHPNIAKLLDGGLTENELPYFTMEYVKGKPIDIYCDENKLSIEDRLKIFLKVCAAVQYAHQNLVIHRDLKPGNILITKDGSVKLLDFGIAKVLKENESSDYTLLTRTGLHIMTPEYASPEQVRGETVTTATDIYSLGLILYHLLSGHPPYVLKKQSAVELEKIICGTEPQKPSTIVKTKTFGDGIRKSITPKEISLFRKTQPEKLQKKLSGDLDNICLMALRKEPERRYPSAEQLYQDIWNHLHELPIIARQNTFLYRTQKFLQRNKIAAIAAVSIFILISILTTFYFIQLKEERDKARLEAKKAEQVADFLKNIFKVADPSESRGETITAKELLDRGAKKIDQELENQPDVKANMLDVIGRVFLNLGSYNKADTLFQESYKVRTSIYDSNSVEVSKSLVNLGEISVWKGNYPKAKIALNKAVSIQSKKLDENDPERISGLNNLAFLYSLKGNYDDADSLYKNVIDLYKINFGNKNPGIFTTLNNRALALHENGKYEKAEKIYGETLDLQKRYYGNKPHPEVATTTYNFAQLLRDKGDYEKAEGMYRQALAMDIKLHGNEHPDVAYSLQGLASILRQKGNYAEAEKLYSECLRIREKFLGENHPDVAYAIFNLGLVDLEIQKLDDAEKNYLRVLEIQKKQNSENSLAIAKTMNQLGEVQYYKGNLSKALKYFNNAKNLMLASSGENHLAYATNLLERARINSKYKNYDTAIVLAEKAIEISVNILGEKNVPYNSSAFNFLAKIYEEKGDYRKADSCFNISYLMHKSIYSFNHPRTANVMLDYGNLLIRMDSLSKASRLISQASTVMNNLLDKDNWHISKAASIKGTLLAAEKKYPQAESLLLTSFNSLKNQLGIKNIITQDAAKRLADFYNTSKKKSLAAKYKMLLTKYDLKK